MNKLFPTLALSALLLAGCGGTEEPTVPPTVPPAPVAETAPAVPETTEETRFTQPPETLPDPTEETVALSYTAYHVTYTFLEDSGTESYTFQGIDPQGNVVWTLETPVFDMGMTPRIMPVGTWEDRFLYNEDGTLVALDITTGEELWRNQEFQGSFASESSVLVDPAGFVYLCGWDTPDLFVCDMAGRTVLRINGFEDREGNAFAIRQEDNELVITSEIPDGSREHRVPMDWIPQPQG